MKMTAGMVWAGIAALGAVAVLSGQSATGEDKVPRLPPKACLSYPLETTRVIDSNTLYLEDRLGTAALIKMKGPCLETNEAVGIKYYGASQICGPMDVDISGSVLTGIPRLCMIDTITPLSKDEAKAYSGR